MTGACTSARGALRTAMRRPGGESPACSRSGLRGSRPGDRRARVSAETAAWARSTRPARPTAARGAPRSATAVHPSRDRRRTPWPVSSAGRRLCARRASPQVSERPACPSPRCRGACAGSASAARRCRGRRRRANWNRGCRPGGRRRTGRRWPTRPAGKRGRAQDPRTSAPRRPRYRCNAPNRPARSRSPARRARGSSGRST